VSPLVLSTLSKRRVWREDDFLSADEGWKIPHISLTDWADVFVIAPCTANVLRMCADGDSSTLIGAALLACSKPVVLFPAMNCNMLGNPATQRHISQIKSVGHTVVDPDSGMLACGYEGKGRLPSNNVIYENVWRVLCPKKDMTGIKLLVTAGPTHEYIDPCALYQQPKQRQNGLLDRESCMVQRR
jgi:phosphopantothenoylcysteine decarboxylase/phosphopantothenate--cysteine ligase